MVIKTRSGNAPANMDVVVVGAAKAGATAPGYPHASEWKRHLAAVHFKGGPGEVVFHTRAGRNPVLLVGTGEAPAKESRSAALNRLRKAACAAARTLRARGFHKAAVDLARHPAFRRLKGADMGRALAESFVLSDSRFTKYLSDKDEKAKGLKTVEFLEPQRDAAAFRTGVAEGKETAAGTLLARTVVNESPSVLTPKGMEAEARRMARENRLTIKVLDEAALKRGNFNAFLAVGQGSANPPRLIHLIYKPARAGRNTPKIGFIGKGITFDSGGLNLKPSGSMETMKCDMSGSAAVLGAMQAVARLKPNVEVHGFLGMAENMPDGNSYRGGDIIVSKSGKSVEIMNTDAEGRLVLIDTLTYAQEFKLDKLVDLATLTGACCVALGLDYAGIMGNDHAWIDAVLAAGDEAGELMWHLPLPEEYGEFVKGPVSDLRNAGGSRWGGALTAGLFLKAVVDEKTPWVHMDIAGPAFRETDNAETPRHEGTGYGVRTLVKLAQSVAAGKKRR